MSRILVIDSLARSGTTLLAALVNSQANSASLRAMFHEGLACGLGRWPYGIAQLPLLEETQRIVVFGGEHGLDGGNEAASRHVANSCLSWLRMKLKMPIRFDASYLLAFAYERARAIGQTALFDEQGWTKILDRPVKGLNDLDTLYQDICAAHDLNVLGLRWNQGLFYAPKWLRNPDHFWCTILRNPLDRAASAKLTHQWPFEKSLATSLSYAEKIDQMQGSKNFRCIYYEDLVEDPENTLRQIYEWVGMPLKHAELEKIYGQRGKPYRSESAELAEMHGDHRIGKAYAGIYKSAVGRQDDVMPDAMKKVFISTLSQIPVYRRYWGNGI